MPAARRTQRSSNRTGEGPLVGFHIPTSGSVALTVETARELGCTTFQIFTGNPRIWSPRPISGETALAFRENRLNAGFAKLAAHMPYLPNLASSEVDTMRMSRAALKEGLGRAQLLGIDYLVIHLGSHHGEGMMEGAKNIADGCNEVLTAMASSSSSDEGPDDAGKRTRTVVLLENMAGQGNGVGSRFEELDAILDGIRERERVGVCFDTCHAFVAGYDISTRAGVRRTLDAFDEVVGLDAIKLVHLNDSKGALGCHLDRHDRVGRGRIGTEGFGAFLGYDDSWAFDIPLVMEPPEHDLPSYTGDIKLVRKLLGTRPSARS